MTEQRPSDGMTLDELREFARELDADAYDVTDAKVAEYAAKLRLREGA